MIPGLRDRNQRYQPLGLSGLMRVLPPLIDGFIVSAGYICMEASHCCILRATGLVYTGTVVGRCYQAGTVSNTLWHDRKGRSSGYHCC